MRNILPSEQNISQMSYIIFAKLPVFVIKMNETSNLNTCPTQILKLTCESKLF